MACTVRASALAILQRTQAEKTSPAVSAPMSSNCTNAERRCVNARSMGKTWKVPFGIHSCTATGEIANCSRGKGPSKRHGGQLRPPAGAGVSYAVQPRIGAKRILPSLCLGKLDSTSRQLSSPAGAGDSCGARQNRAEPAGPIAG